MLTKLNRCIRATSILSGVLAFAITGQLFAQAWDLDKHQSKEEAQIIGNWSGELLGKPFEIALWPDPEFPRLIGTIIWDSCITTTYAEWSWTPVTQTKPSFPDEVSTNRIFKFGVWPETYVRTGEPDGERSFKFGNNNCQENPDPYPAGYRLEQIDHRFYFVSDESHASLTFYTQKKGDAAVEKHETLSRSRPSAQMSVAIKELSQLENYKQDNSSVATIADPSKNYLDVYESLIFDPSLIYSKDWYYWKEHYDFAAAKVLSPVFNGEFADVKTVRDDEAYYSAYVSLMETYNSECNEYIDDKTVVKVSHSSTRRDQYGNYDKNSVTRNIEIERRYSDTYIKAKEAHMRQFNRHAELHRVMERLYATEGCDSPTTYQLLENYHRVLNYMTPLQRAGR